MAHDIDIAALLDFSKIKEMVQAHFHGAGIPVGIVDARTGEVLAGAGWQDICTKFHRVNPGTADLCRESDTSLAFEIDQGRTAVRKCPMGLWDIGVPVMVDGRHTATIFLGQFFYEAEVPDRGFFIRQAKRYGFDEDAYLAALDRVPAFSRAWVEDVLRFHVVFSEFLGRTADQALAAEREIKRRLKVEEALRASEEKYRLLVENQTDLVVKFDPRGILLYVSPSFCRLFGKTEDELLGTPFMPLVLEDDLARSLDALESLSRPPHRAYAELRARTTEGKRWLSWRVSGVQNEDGVLDEVIAVGRDVTGRKDAEDERQNQFNLLLSLLEALPVPVFFKDMDGRYVGCNQSFADYFGLERESIIGKGVRELFPHVEAEIFYTRDAELFSRGGIQIYDTTVRKATGEKRRVIFHKATYDDASGAMSGLVGVVTDVEDREQSRDDLEVRERELREALAWKNVILNTSPAGVLVVTGERVISEVNPRMTEIFGYGADEMLGRHVAMLHVSEDTALEFGDRFYSQTASQDVVSGQYRMKRKDGTIFWVAISGAAVDPQDLSRGVVWVITDDTERRRSIEALSQARSEAEAANRAKSEFLATMSHEIRTPLNGVMGMLQLLKAADPGPRESEYVDTALRSSSNLLHILSDILDISRIEAGTLDISEEEFETVSLIDPVMGALADEAARKGLELTLDVPPDLPLRLVGDAGRIRQVLFNLVGNAVKYTDKGSVRFIVETLSSGDEPGQARLLFTVSDTGIGIDHDRLADIFNPFTQLDGSLGRKYGGAGLGLAIVKRLVSLMNGSLVMDSAPGQGTRAYFELRLGQPQSMPGTEFTAPEEVAELPSRERPYRVLVVEDEQVNRLAVTRMLGLLGFEADEAKDGRQALEKLAAGNYDCVLMDIQMPRMDGLETTRRIRDGNRRGIDAGLPIVALTAHAMVGDRETFLASGMDDYLAKPVDMDELKNVLTRILARR